MAGNANFVLDNLFADGKALPDAVRPHNTVWRSGTPGRSHQ